MNAKRVFEMAE
jgi:ornithine decarboxylase